MKYFKTLLIGTEFSRNKSAAFYNFAPGILYTEASLKARQKSNDYASIDENHRKLLPILSTSW